MNRFIMTTAAAMTALLIGAGAAAAQPATSNSNSNAPIEIFADNTLEWNRTQKTYTARGNAIARQGNMQVKSDTLTAHYGGGKGGGTDTGGLGGSIEKMTASGNVEISSAPYTAYGDKAVYDVASGLATLTGGKLRIETPTESLSAQDKIEFDTAKNRLSAIGKATATRGTDSVSSDNLSAFFAGGDQNAMTLQRIVADSAVTVKTARETVTGDSGVYDVAAGKATLRGKVRILQGENWLEGTRAEVDLKTGVSKLFGDAPRDAARPSLIVNGVATPPPAPVGDGRVRGVFYPKKKETTATP